MGVAQVGLGDDATVVEHYASDEQRAQAQPSAPLASGTVSEPTDVTGFSDTQKACSDYVDAHRAAAVRNDDAALQSRVNDALAHMFLGGKIPSFISGHDAARDSAAKQDASAYDPLSAELAAGFEQMSEADVEQVVSHAVVKGLPRETAQGVAEFAHAAQLPEIVAQVVLDRALKHHTEGWGTGQQLTAAEQEDLTNECARAFGSLEKATSEARLARVYLESVGGAALLARVDANAGSLLFDPRTISQLAMMARAKGIK